MALKHAEPGDVMRLPLGAELATAKTSALAKTDRFEAIRVVLPAGGTVPTHKVDGFFTLFCLEGHAVLEAGKDIELRAGDWLYMERGAPHAVRAIEDSALLLHIMFD